MNKYTCMKCLKEVCDNGPYHDDECQGCYEDKQEEILNRGESHDGR